MTPTEGVIHCLVQFLAGAGDLGTQNIWQADTVAAEIDDYVRESAIGQGMSDRELQKLRDEICLLPQYKQTIRDIADAQIARSQPPKVIAEASEEKKSGQAGSPPADAAEVRTAIDPQRKRKPGPAPDPKRAQQIYEAAVKPYGEDWRQHLETICETLDAQDVKRPANWENARWLDQLGGSWRDRDAVAKLIEYWIAVAKQLLSGLTPL